MNEKIERCADWDLENARVSIPITEKVIRLVKNAMKNKRPIKWSFNVSYGEKE